MTNAKTSYEKEPVKVFHTETECAWKGYQQIASVLADTVREKNKTILTIECYPGTDCEEIIAGITRSLPAAFIINSETCAKEPEEIDSLLAEDLTEDRVFGIMNTRTLDSFFIKIKLEEKRKEVSAIESGVILICGVGASLISQGDILIYADMPRWEIQLRYRKGMPNWHCRNNDAPFLTKYKRGFFAEWRMADRLKKKLLPEIDFWLDTCQKDNPVLTRGDNIREALVKIAQEPFRTVPYFDPGVWGGNWMKEKFDLPENGSNYAWSFDGVPEENSILLSFNGIITEIPAMDLVLYQPRPLLGERVHARFGAEFPIRFDLLDTIGGQNLSLQVHPLTEYIQEKFNMHYTQDESYYILDIEGGCELEGDHDIEGGGGNSNHTKEKENYVYLGVKNEVDKGAMKTDLYRASQGEIEFPAEKYVNKIPVKKHDHILIPAGTVHCSGAGTMVLEISATPYIFTFKLWDWGRLGLDGLPRPIHLEHGMANIQWDRNTDWIHQNLLHQETIIENREGVMVERTGLHNREFLETFRYTITSEVLIETTDSVNMLNLVEGTEAVITSPQGTFAPYTIHYAETCIVPAAVKEYQILPGKGCEEIKVIMARVR